MYVILAAGFFSLIPPVYFLRLMADARRLERRLPARPAANIENGLSSAEESGRPPVPDPGRPSAAPN